MIWIGYRNTLVYVVVGTAINILLTTMGGYVLSRKNLKLKNPIMFFIAFTMYFSGGMIPDIPACPISWHDRHNLGDDNPRGYLNNKPASS